MDVIDLFYDVCELYEDDLERVSRAIKEHGTKDRLPRIYKNVQTLNVMKYHEQLINIIERVRNIKCL